MNIHLETISDLHGYLSVSFGSEDYMPKVNEELKRVKKNAHIKGFRQGAIPDAMVKNLYGDGIKADILNKLLNQTVTDYQKNNELQFIGDLLPVPSETDDNQNEAMSFKFEVGIAPKPDISSILNSVQLSKYQVLIPESRIDEEILHLKERYGESTPTEGAIIKGDFVELDAMELDGDNIKEGGWKTQFPVLLGEHAREDFIEKLLNHKSGDTIEFNITEVEKNLSEQDIRKYLLKIPEDQSSDFKPGDHYRATISKVMRKTPAELSEDLYKKAFGPDTTITSEEELRSNIKTSLENYFGSECRNLLDIEIVKTIVKNSAIKFPDQFLKKWLQSTYEEWASKEGHDLEHGLHHFKEGMCWNLIREKIIAENKIQIRYEDITGIVIEEMKKQYPGIQLPDASWQELAKRNLSDKEKQNHYYESAINNKSIQWIKENISLTDSEISLDEFREKVKQINVHNH